MRNWLKPLRPPRRSPFFLRLVFPIIFFAVITTVCGVSSHVGVLAGKLQQSGAPVVEKSHLPSAEWAAKLREMAGKIVSVSTPPARIELADANMSSLNADAVAAIDESLKSNLTNLRMRIVSNEPSDVQIKVTLSEGVEGFLLVAEVRRGVAQQVFIVPLPKVPTAIKKTGGVSVDADFIWEQPGKVLDFALPPPTAGEVPRMIVLEAGRIVFYARKESQWQLSQSIIIPPLRPWQRAPRGRIDISHGVATGIARLPGIDCNGDFAHPDTIQCEFVDQSSQSWNGPETDVSKTAATGGESAALSLECDGRPVALATGNGDWTEADFVQAVEMPLARGEGGATSGKPVEFEGPVTFPWSTVTGAAANAVVQNLKTGNYEAYVVTATCSQ